MLRNYLLTGLVLAITAGLAAPIHAQPLPVSLDEATAIDHDVDIQPLATPGGATDLAQVSECLDGAPRIPRVTLGWTASELPALAQRLDISKFRDGFELGRYETTGPVAGDLGGAAVDTAETGINYYWRVLTRTSSGWISSAIGRFEVPVCPLDKPRELPGS